MRTSHLLSFEQNENYVKVDEDSDNDRVDFVCKETKVDDKSGSFDRITLCLVRKHILTY